jgi:hypothetical protein
MPHYQLTIAPPPTARYQAWALTRRPRDFTDAELDIVSASPRSWRPPV